MYDAIIISPGPGLPDEVAGQLLPFLKKYQREILSHLGVCPGGQAIVVCKWWNFKQLP